MKNREEISTLKKQVSRLRAGWGKAAAEGASENERNRLSTESMKIRSSMPLPSNIKLHTVSHVGDNYLKLDPVDDDSGNQTVVPLDRIGRIVLAGPTEGED